MNIACCNGDFECNSWEEIEEFIRKSSGNPYDDIWICEEDEEYPCLAMLINGEHVCVHWYDDEGGIWQSVGHGEKDVEFIANGNEKSEMPSDAVVSLEEALQCAKQFFVTQEQPDCIEWREL